MCHGAILDCTDATAAKHWHMPKTPPLDHDTFIAALRTWDGRTAADLKALYQAHHHATDFLPRLVEACEDVETETAATWLIKHHCEMGATPIPGLLRQQILASLPNLTRWDARLHLLQIMDHLRPIPTSLAPAIYDALADGAASARPLLRAWSLFAAAQLAVQHDTYAQKVHHLLETAADDNPKGAVAVRLREATALMAQKPDDA
ncbi:hypothetical protein So717_34390 [Roseobacter cerasinus]|uniref:HEAT repeat domain-containing protein n=1 Tax=Roseobacter cerasinus TaxID=2602289 RepID=A0A640VZQ1_9RHOB|nr:hypothetical protein [Roseobacter cerasinus]GFE51686.1 hypothetical protein So717_34390 [Roseobacter cerasinus]